MFSAVQRRPGPEAKTRPGPPAGTPSETSYQQLSLTREQLSQHDNLQGAPRTAFAQEHRTKRGMITGAHSPMRSPMISEMKGINALNLEPALPKLDDKTRNDWINFKQSQTRSAGKPNQGNGLKKEFEQSLALIKNRQEAKERHGEDGTP